MITGDLKNKIDSLWDIFAAGGLVNPLEVIEQITYLMFIHDLDDVDNKKAKECEMLGLPFSSIFADEVKIGDRNIDGKQLKWSVFRDFPAEKMYSVMQEWVFPFIKNLHSDKNSAYSKYMDDAIFKLPTPILLSKVVDSLDEIYKLMNEIQSVDVRGDVYEYLLSKIAQSGRNGQFRTPRHIIRMMVEMMDPAADEMICDPACGTSGFLVASGEYLREKKKEDIFYNKANRDHYMNHMFYGYDMDRTMLRIGAMNMMTHGIDNPCIEYRDSLSDQNSDKNKYTLVLANPPFKGSLDAESVSADLLKMCKTKKTELLFLTLFIRILQVGGRCACIVPDGVLFGSSAAHKAIRKEIVENQKLQAVISMPSGVFAEDGGNFGSKEKPIAYRVSGKCWINNHAHVLKPKIGLDVDYLCYSLMFYNVDGMVNGATRQKLTQAAMRKMQIPSRSIEDQKHIVDELNRIVKIKEQRFLELQLLDKLIKARFVEMFGDAVANPKKWPVKKLKDLSVQINSGNTPKGGSENYVKEGIAFFRSQNVWKNRLEMEDIAYIDAKTHANMKRSSLKHGDILMTKTGRINTENSSLGRAALYLGEDDMANVNGHVYFIRLKPGVSNMFVLRILVSPEYVDLIRGVCVGGIDKRQLNKEHIEDFPIICPPTDMVNEYVKFVCQVDKSKLLSLIKLLEQLITYLYNVFIIYRQDKGEEVERHE